MSLSTSTLHAVHAVDSAAKLPESITIAVTCHMSKSCLHHASEASWQVFNKYTSVLGQLIEARHT